MYTYEKLTKYIFYYFNFQYQLPVIKFLYIIYVKMLNLYIYLHATDDLIKGFKL